MKWTIGALALAVVALIALSIALRSKDHAVAQAETRADSAVQSAQEAESRRTADSVAHADSMAALAALRAAEAAEVAAGEQAAGESRDAAEGGTQRLREKLTAEHRADLDQVTAYWQETVRELERVIAALKRDVTLIEAEAAAERSYRVRETERADNWKAAWEAERGVSDALRRKDVNLGFVRFDIECGPGGGIGSNDPLRPEVQVACIVPVI